LNYTRAAAKLIPGGIEVRVRRTTIAETHSNASGVR